MTGGTVACGGDRWHQRERRVRACGGQGGHAPAIVIGLGGRAARMQTGGRWDPYD